MKSLKTIHNQKLAFEFMMERYGWVRLTFTLDFDVIDICLSHIFEPFDEMMDWIDNVGRENLPAQLNIDEEGEITSLIVNSYDDNHIQLLIQDFLNKEIKMAAIIHRIKFLNKFCFEFMRFFRHDFDPNHWQSRNDLKQTVLNRQWYFCGGI